MTEFLSHSAVEDALHWPQLIEQLRNWFADGKVEAPPRQVLSIPAPAGSKASDPGSMLIMPAWLPGEALGVKVVTYCPWNASQGEATINAGYMLFNGATGKLQTVLDGDALTIRRTAAASALAADYLARNDARHHLIVGTGQLARSVGEAYASVRAPKKISVWGRNPEKALQIARELARVGLPAEAVTNLKLACEKADIVSTVTASQSPIVQGDWLRPGTHLDLIGSFRADMRESDDLAISQAEVFVDDRAGAQLAGDLAQPLATGHLQPNDIKADLKSLCCGEHPGRTSKNSYTVFKSAGVSLEDLAAAVQVNTVARENRSTAC
ncbi:ornithine cyclodeaminase family protein [Roseibium sp. HPY-6]|uniref:ornithine cyclodeaminase family protein n=1 Tax=Roseibium sp. HPY-6 TaxID=3229852 RepID=UPI00338DCA2A